MTELESRNFAAPKELPDIGIISKMNKNQM